METKANYAMVGFFTVMVILMSFGFIYWMSEYRRSDDMVPMLLRIPGSANGLSVGSAVRFNGIPVGQVRELNFDPKAPRYSIALTEIRADAPVYKDTRAVLEIQGLTGTSYIELSGGTITNEPILKTARETGKPAMLEAEQSSVTNLLATASEIMAKASTTVTSINTFVDKNADPLSRTISNAETFSKALDDNAKGIDEFLKSVSSLSTTFTQLSGRLDTTLASVDTLVKSVDPKKIDTILSNAEKVSGDLAVASSDVTETLQSIKSAAARIDELGKNADETLKKVDVLMAAVDPAKVNQSVEDISKAVADARSSLASVRGVADTIGKHQPDIDRILTNVGQMSDKLNKSSDRVDGILAKLDGLLGNGDSASLFAEAKATLEAYRKIADTVNARIGPIADNLQRFSGSGLQDLRALIAESRNTMQSINTAVSKIGNNPQQLLFGGEEVKQYGGRTRR